VLVLTVYGVWWVHFQKYPATLQTTHKSIVHQSNYFHRLFLNKQFFYWHSSINTLTDTLSSYFLQRGDLIHKRVFGTDINRYLLVLYPWRLPVGECQSLRAIFDIRQVFP
jgi:hypothetical protein